MQRVVYIVNIVSAEHLESRTLARGPSHFSVFGVVVFGHIPFFLTVPVEEEIIVSGRIFKRTSL